MFFGEVFSSSTACECECMDDKPFILWYIVILYAALLFHILFYWYFHSPACIYRYLQHFDYSKNIVHLSTFVCHSINHIIWVSQPLCHQVIWFSKWCNRDWWDFESVLMSFVPLLGADSVWATIWALRPIWNVLNKRVLIALSNYRIVPLMEMTPSIQPCNVIINAAVIHYMQNDNWK